MHLSNNTVFTLCMYSIYMYMYTLVNYGIHGPCVACAELYTRQSYFVHIHHVAHKHQAYDCELGKGKILLFHWTSNRFTSHEPTLLQERLGTWGQCITSIHWLNSLTHSVYTCTYSVFTVTSYHAYVINYCLHYQYYLVHFLQSADKGPRTKTSCLELRYVELNNYQV